MKLRAGAAIEQDGMGIEAIYVAFEHVAAISGDAKEIILRVQATSGAKDDANVVSLIESGLDLIGEVVERGVLSNAGVEVARERLNGIISVTLELAGGTILVPPLLPVELLPLILQGIVEYQSAFARRVGIG